jgi:hypothetical protein
LNGEPDIVEIRKTFDTADECRDWEHRVLYKMKVNENSHWLNMTTNKGIASNHAINRSEQTKKLLSQNHADMSGKNNPRWGKTCSLETRNKISAANKGRVAWNKGVPRTEEDRNKMKGKRPSISAGNHPKFDPTVFTFVNVSTNEIFIGTKYDLRCLDPRIKASNLADMINKKRTSCRGWTHVVHNY